MSIEMTLVLGDKITANTFGDIIALVGDRMTLVLLLYVLC